MASVVIPRDRLVSINIPKKFIHSHKSLILVAVSTNGVRSCGDYHTIIVDRNGSTYGFGDNEFGQLGLGDRANRIMPVKFLKYVLRLCGGLHTILYNDDAHSSAFGCGYNLNGQLGLGDADNRLTPTLINGSWINVSCGGSHSVLIDTNGDAHSSGLASSGQLGLLTDDQAPHLTFTELANVKTGRLEVTEGASFNELLVTEDLNVTGNSTLDSLNVSGNSTINGTLTATNRMTCKTQILIGQDSTVSQYSTNPGSLFNLRYEESGDLRRLYFVSGSNMRLEYNRGSSHYVAIHASSYQGVSDDRLKINEKLISDVSCLFKLRPQVYDKMSKLDGNVEDARFEPGLIAQEIWYDCPELRHLVHVGAGGTPADDIKTSDDPTVDPDYSSWVLSRLRSTILALSHISFVGSKNIMKKISLKARRNA